MNSTAIYIRLSKEDNYKELNNSESVINQRQLLLKYVVDNSLNLYDIYIDDGYTGTNFDRPEFKRMINDIEKGLINTVVVKDLSRLGRDYIKTGEYVEKWFPMHNIRFISILDDIDSFSNLSGNDFLPFKSIINDMYSKDNSKKIKAALRTKQLEGKWVGGCPPFGYMTLKSDKNHLIINEEEAKIVRLIYKLFINNYSINKISLYLYDNNIKTPNTLRKNQQKIDYWSSTTIKNILSNELYTGDMIQNRRRRISYKIRNIIKNDRKDWIVVLNTHDPIIDRNTFEKVQEKLNNNNTTNNKCEKKLLEGLVYCSHCNKKLTIQRGKYEYFVCNTYKKYSKQKLCTNHYISYKKMEKEIIKLINKTLDKYDISILDNKILLNRLIEKITVDDNKEVNIYFYFSDINLSP